MIDDEDEQPDLETSYVISDARRGGYEVSLEGKHLGTFPDMTKAVRFIGFDMEAQKYWPDVYYVNERGNVELLSIRVTKRGKASYKYVRGWV